MAAALVAGSQFQIGNSVFALLPTQAPLPPAANHLEVKPTPPIAIASNAENVSAKGYERLDRIGAGGQATVYRARAKSDNSLVAIKYLNNTPADDDRRFFLQKFKTQILVGTTIRHPNCVRIFGGDPNNNPPFLIEELIVGNTLRDRMVSGRLPFEECVRILGATCDALFYLHRRNLIHRDVKPSNIMLGANNLVKLIDFGLIRIAGAPRITQIGMCLGTPHYMSREQVLGDSSRITFQSDLYSLGVVAYEMFTGALPFDGSNETIMNMHLKSKPRPPRELEKNLPEHIAAAILRALEKDPANRFANAREMAQAFGYTLPFSDGDSPDPAKAPAGGVSALRLQNVATGAVIQIQSSPTLLSRSLVNPSDKSISRSHGRLYWQDGFWHVAEQADHPTTGLYLNGLRVDSEGDVIQTGDELRLGQTLLRVIL
jgi:serine/threonine protein kinase